MYIEIDSFGDLRGYSSLTYILDEVLKSIGKQGENYSVVDKLVMGYYVGCPKEYDINNIPTMLFYTTPDGLVGGGRVQAFAMKETNGVKMVVETGEGRPIIRNEFYRKYYPSFPALFGGHLISAKKLVKVVRNEYICLLRAALEDDPKSVWVAVGYGDNQELPHVKHYLKSSRTILYPTSFEEEMWKEQFSEAYISDELLNL